MASTMPTGDRSRWAPTRKSGMTVLGKVPKPINLPSQRSENHGLDPNVEIVPKGTLSWGSRPSSTLPNVWGSSALLSTNADGSSISPSYVNGFPSSGGSGTRPSTAGSDRSLEPACNAWGPNSRPSSSSGTLTPKQTSIMVTRPWSAETRPSSTQLSRLVETPVESKVTWGATRIAERVGVASWKNNEFTLSSGDFPTLASDKNSESQQRGHSSHVRPGSASGTAATQKGQRPLSAGDGNVNAYSEHGNVNSWKADGSPYVGGGCPPNLNWQRDPQHSQPHPGANIPPHQFGPRHSAPVHFPTGVWYRDGAVCAPYRPAGPPGGNPIEPYAYYPQFPARPPPNLEPPGPGTGPDGYGPRNGESYLHHQPSESYMTPSHPVIPVRPLVYPSPVSYEGYYGPPHASFCSERGVHVMGSSDQPGAYDQCSNQNANLDPGKFHARPAGHASVMTKEQKKSEHAHETRSTQFKVLLRQHDWEVKNDAQEQGEQSAIAGQQHLRRNIRKDERMLFLKSTPGQEVSSEHSSDWEDHSPNPVITNKFVDSSKEADDSLVRKPESATFPVHDWKHNPVTKKNATLIGKIEGSNNKAPIADDHNGGEDKIKHFKVANKAYHSTKLVSANSTSTEYASTSGTVTSPDESDASTENRNRKSSGDRNVFPRKSESLVSVVNMSDSSKVGKKALSQVHRRDHVQQGRVDDHAKLRSNSQDDNDWIKKSPGRDSLVMSTMTSGETGLGVCLLDCHASLEATDETQHDANTAGVSYATSSSDSMDHKTQRAKLKEIAMRRAKELQKEEEERTREQKAKALAKLEELNKRASAQSSDQKIYDLPPNSDAKHTQDSGADADAKIDAIIIGSLGPISAQNSNSLLQANDSRIKTLAVTTDLPLDSSSQDSAIPYELSLSLGQEKSTDEVITHVTSSDFYERNVSEQSQMSSRRRPDSSQEENLSDKPITAESMGSPKDICDVALPTASSDRLPNTVATSVHHRKRNNRNSRNKNKLYETLTSSKLPTSAPTEENLAEGATEGGNTQQLTPLVAETTSDPSQSSTDQGSITSSNQGRSQATEKMHGRVGNRWKPESSRKTTRNQQAIRHVDKFHGSEAVIWAPVRPSNKNETSEEVRQMSTSETINHSSGKNSHDVQNDMKTKRAVMERYVPKPVAKELSQQDNSQDSSPSLNWAASGNMASKLDSGSKSSECGGLDGSALGKPEIPTEIKNEEVNNKPSKRGKLRASWRQRSSAESPSVLQSSSLGGVSSDPTKPSTSKLDTFPEKQFLYEDWSSTNDNSVPIPAVIKDQGVPSRQRQHQSVAPTGNKDLQSRANDEIATQSPAVSSNESDRRNAFRTRNQSSGSERTRSHWKPKYQAYSHNHQHESREDGGRRVAPQEARFDEEGTVDAERSTAGNREFNNGKKGILEQSKEETPSANQDLLTNAEVVTVDVDGKHEQPVSSEPRRRQGCDSSRINRGQRASYRGSRGLGGQGDVKRKGNSHFEYQQIGLKNPIVGEEAQVGPQAPGLRYEERGQNHSRRRGGHFNGQRTGAAVQVGVSYSRGE